MKRWTYGTILEEYELKIFKATLREVFSHDSNEPSKIVKLHSKDACNVILKNEMGQVCFIKQYRFGTDSMEIELPGGLVEELEDPSQAAIRELMEETGYEVEMLKFIGKVPSNPAIMNNYVHHYSGFTCQTAPLIQNLDEAEDIEVLWLNTSQIAAFIADGSIAHPHTLSALFLAAFDAAKWVENFNNLFIKHV
jgi:ADP-ribose pyrophosphatase